MTARPLRCAICDKLRPPVPIGHGQFAHRRCLNAVTGAEKAPAITAAMAGAMRAITVDGARNDGWAPQVSLENVMGVRLATLEALARRDLVKRRLKRRAPLSFDAAVQWKLTPKGHAASRAAPSL